MSPEKSKPSLVEILPLGGYDLPLTYGAKESLFEIESWFIGANSLGVRRVTGLVSSISPAFSSKGKITLHNRSCATRTSSESGTCAVGKMGFFLLRQLS